MRSWCVWFVFLEELPKPSDDEGTYLLEELTHWNWLAVAKGSFEAKKRRKEET